MTKVAILGYGGRGKNYAWVLRFAHKNTAKVVAVIDTNTERLEVAKHTEKLTDDCLFNNIDDFLAKGKIADWLFICTQDRQHYEHTIKAIEAGYNILLEKPITPNVKECVDIEKRAKEKGVKIAVCHVLRYTSFYNKIKEIIDSKVLGDIIAIEMEENVGYWHQAHSFVRGDWHNTEQSCPMIMAKCCHDLDLAVFLTDSKCKQISSVGKLNHFKADKTPTVHAKRCIDCNNTDCPYDARKLYIDKYKKRLSNANQFGWTLNRIVPDGIPTLPKLEQAIKDTDFGRCVYDMDNDTVDYQVVQMLFDNGTNCTLTMSAFSPDIFRRITIRGTLGYLDGEFETGKLNLSIYGKKTKKVSIKNSISGHGGGDEGLINSLLNGTCKTDITESIESHIMAFAAEKSRAENGTQVDVTEYKNSIIKEL